jgi:PAS domain S-box-containing protein
MEYLIVDRGFNILEKSIDVQRFADCPDEVILGNDVRLGFPELVGLEDILIDILEGRETSFDLESLARYSDTTTPLYIDLHISRKQSSEYIESQLIFLLKEVTDKIILEQKLVQSSNETSLLLSSLKAAHHYIDKIISSLPLALLVTNKIGKIKTVNQAAKELFGYSEKELINSPITTLIADDTILGKISQQHLGFENSVNNAEVTCKTKSGEKIFVAFSCSAVETDIEESQDFIYIGQNITENKRAQQRQAVQYATTRILSESATLKQATPKLLQAIGDSLGWDVGEIWIAEGNEEWRVRSREWGQGSFQDSPASPLSSQFSMLQLRCWETWVQPSVDISEFVRVTQQTTFAPGVELPGRVWASCSPHWITDVVSDPNFVRSPSASIAGLHAAFGFPIQGDKDILGVMTFFSREVQTPDEELLQMMMAIGSQIGQFIQRKQAEEKLKESEERLQAVMDNSTAVIFVKDTQGRYLFVNRKFEQVFHITNDKIQGKTDYDIFPKETADIFRENDLKTLAKDAPLQIEEVVSQDDRLDTYLSAKFLLRDVLSGHPYAVCGIATDITERKQIEEALRKSEAKNRALLEAIPDLMLRISKEGTYLEVIPAQNFDTLVASNLMTGKTIYEVLPPEIAQQRMYYVEQALSTGKIQCFEYQLLVNGRQYDYEARIVISGNDEVLFIARDITEQKQMQIALRESEERYRDLFENANDLIQSITLDGRFLYVNRAWRETLGYSNGEISQMAVLDVIHPDSKALCLQVFQRVKSGEKIDQFETEFITKDGKVISLEGSLNCRVIDGKPVAVRGIFRDVTARKLAEVALRHQQKQTERLLLNILPSPIADRLKQRIGTIADEFAEVTVLFADIVGFTELSARSSPTELVRLLNTIFSEFDKLAELHELEKIKTIGDAYMVVGGLPVSKSNHAQSIAEMALDMQSAIADFRNKTGKQLNIRVGINTGPVVAGVIGIKKFSYDLWGDTVNTASRMESHGLPGKIQVTAATYERLREQYLFQERGFIQVKGKGEMMTYFLIGRNNSPALRDFQMKKCPTL